MCTEQRTKYETRTKNRTQNRKGGKFTSLVYLLPLDQVFLYVQKERHKNSPQFIFHKRHVGKLRQQSVDTHPLGFRLDVLLWQSGQSFLSTLRERGDCSCSASLFPHVVTTNSIATYTENTTVAATTVCRNSASNSVRSAQLSCENRVIFSAYAGVWQSVVNGVRVKNNKT